MNSTRPEMLEEYVSNLQQYLDGEGERTLERAYALARKALDNGVGVLEMAALHHEAMAQVMRGALRSVVVEQRIKAAETFLVESLSPFELTHSSFRESNAALRRVNERLEEEAKRIAHALHAEASQLLVSAHLELDSVARELPQDTRTHLDRIRRLLDKVSHQIRRLSHELRPTILDDLGLLPALRFLAEGVSARSSTPVVVEGKLDARLPVAIETAIYRAVQEALNNMIKHSRATVSVVRVAKDSGRVVCSVKDDGRGFDEATVLRPNGTRGIGLIGVRERLHALGGRLEISSAPGRGTELIITVPSED